MIAPQCEQNLEPRNTIPKHEGHVAVASFTPQCSQDVASGDAGAPHIGHFIVAASMTGDLFSVKELFAGRAKKSTPFLVYPGIKKKAGRILLRP
jgi:hypothetical protein